MKNLKMIPIIVGVAFLTNTVLSGFSWAQDFYLPAPGVMVHLSPQINPPILKGIKVNPDNPFRFDFIMDRGDSTLNNDQLKAESNKLIKYFLASLTIPENDLWVNLSPYEKDRIIPQSFGLTEMGRDLLAEDYMLKQITASLIYPEGATGKMFWKRIYEEAAQRFGTTNIPVNTFNKVWIVPQKAVVYENAKLGTAYVVESKLKVMLEQDYLSLEKHSKGVIVIPPAVNTLGSQIIREIVIPELTKEVNEGQNFSHLRQVYNSLILATWYKKKIKNSILSQVYADKNKVAGVNINDPKEKERIYQKYLQAFKKGVYNYIKEEVDPASQQIIPRKYFSGGVELHPSQAMIVTHSLKVAAHLLSGVGKLFLIAASVLVPSQSVSAENLIYTGNLTSIPDFMSTPVYKYLFSIPDVAYRENVIGFSSLQGNEIWTDALNQSYVKGLPIAESTGAGAYGPSAVLALPVQGSSGVYTLTTIGGQSILNSLPVPQKQGDRWVVKLPATDGGGELVAPVVGSALPTVLELKGGSNQTGLTLYAADYSDVQYYGTSQPSVYANYVPVPAADNNAVLGDITYGFWGNHYITHLHIPYPGNNSPDQHHLGAVSTLTYTDLQHPALTFTGSARIDGYPSGPKGDPYALLSALPQARQVPAVNLGPISFTGVVSITTTSSGETVWIDRNPATGQKFTGIYRVGPPVVFYSKGIAYYSSFGLLGPSGPSGPVNVTFTPYGTSDPIIGNSPLTFGTYPHPEGKNGTIVYINGVGLITHGTVEVGSILTQLNNPKDKFEITSIVGGFASGIENYTIVPVPLGSHSSSYSINLGNFDYGRTHRNPNGINMKIGHGWDNIHHYEGPKEPFYSGRGDNPAAVQNAASTAATNAQLTKSHGGGFINSPVGHAIVGAAAGGALVTGLHFILHSDGTHEFHVGAFTSDRAMAPNGGIDLTANKMNLELQNAGREIKFHVDPAMQAQLKNALGFTSFIIGMQAMTELSLRQFLGV